MVRKKRNPAKEVEDKMKKMRKRQELFKELQKTKQESEQLQLL